MSPLTRFGLAEEHKQMQYNYSKSLSEVYNNYSNWNEIDRYWVNHTARVVRQSHNGGTLHGFHAHQQEVLEEYLETRVGDTNMAATQLLKHDCTWGCRRSTSDR